MISRQSRHEQKHQVKKLTLFAVCPGKVSQTITGVGVNAVKTGTLILTHYASTVINICSYVGGNETNIHVKVQPGMNIF